MIKIGHGGSCKANNKIMIDIEDLNIDKDTRSKIFWKKLKEEDK